jgi:TPR repeat protein
MTSTPTRGTAKNEYTAIERSRRFSFAFPIALLAIAISTFSASPALCGFDEGAADYRVGNYKDALREWSEAAERGDADAQYNLGCLYVRGEGVPQNRALAMELFQRANAQDELDAATWLLTRTPQTDDSRKRFFSGKLKLSGKFHITFVVQHSSGKTMRWPCATDEKDGARIEFNIGLMFDKGGMGLPQDDKQAADFYRQASDRNFAGAQTRLAYLYLEGRGVEERKIEAARLFRRAVAQGDADAQAFLGGLYSSGFPGIPKDLILAYVLLRHAADAGNEVALRHLPQLTSLLSADQLLEGQRLVEKWKNVELPPEVAKRLEPPG